MDALAKGKVLEDSVHAIETMILRESPGYREKDFRIESRKVRMVDGVKHEFDLWVEVDLAKGYKALFVFECKNWADKIGKNEVIVFSEKIAAVQAQKGFFIATDFTADAEAQATKNPRLELLRATELETDVPVPFDFHGIAVTNGTLSVTLIERGLSGDGDKTEVDIGDLDAKLAGQDIELGAFLTDWAKDLTDATVNRFPSAQMAEGNYEQEVSDERTFAEGEMTIGNRDIERLQLTVRFCVRVVRPPVLSHFDVEERGRALLLAPVELVPRATIQAVFTG